VVSIGDTGEEISGTGACVDNITDSGRGIDSDVVSRPCGQKHEIDSRNVTFTIETKYFLLVVL